jgi:hypothetical protein
MNKIIVVRVRKSIKDEMEITLYDGKKLFTQCWRSDSLLNKYFNIYPHNLDFSIRSHNEIHRLFHPNSHIVIDLQSELFKTIIDNKAVFKEMHILKVINRKTRGNRFKIYKIERSQLKNWYETSHRTILFVGTPKPSILDNTVSRHH